MKDHSEYGALASAFALIFVASACSSIKSDAGGNGGDAGTSRGGQGSGGVSGGASGSHAASDAGQAGTDAIAEGGQGDAGDRGDAGEAGVNSGGAGGLQAAGSGGIVGGAGSSAHGGSSGAGGVPATLPLGTLLGPTTDNQLPITVSLAHAGFKIDEFSLFLQDSSGNFFSIGDDKLVKYSPAFAVLWSYSLTNTAGLLINSQTLSVAPDGGIYFGGYINAALPGETFAGETDAVIGKITSAGTLAWIHQWGSSSNDATTRTAVEPDGSVIAHGTSSGQAPGNPATVAGGPWMARYSATGARTWLKQYRTDAGEFNVSDLTIDATGIVRLIGTFDILKVEPTLGAELARVKLNTGNFLWSYLPVVLNPSKDALYSWGECWGTLGRTTGLAKFNLDGDLLDKREVEFGRSAVLDTVENVIWNGGIRVLDSLSPFSVGRTSPPFVVGSNAIYLVGIYTNSYLNGSIAKPTTEALYVGRYDLNGARVWFQEFVFPGDTANTVSSHFSGIVLDANGNPVIATSAYHNGDVGSFIFKLNAATGEIL